MALQRQPSDLKNRVNTCLNRLSDRDTLTVATHELESIARNLNSEGFGAFLTCISSTDSSDKSPVRRQCVRLIGVLSASHGDALSPHLAKMLSSVLRRLRDPDSAVRSACVEAVSSIASEITQPPFSSILKPLIDAIMHEQDNNSQIGASLCLAAAIEASPDPEPGELKKLLPKLLKLVKNDSFKAKPALLSLIGSIVSVGGASSKNVLNSLVPITVEFLISDDWTVRKAAAETLGRLAVAERELLSELKAFCITSLDNRRFDKVKVVRETMNRALEWWKEVAGTSDDVLPRSQSKFAPKDCGSGACSPTPSKSSSDTTRETPHPKKATRPSKSPASSSSSSITSQKNNSIRFHRTKSNVISSCKLDLRKSPDAKLKRTVSLASSLEVDNEDEQKSQNPRAQDSADTVSCSSSNSEVKSTLFNRPPDGKFHRYGNSRSSSRVVPLCEDYNYNMDVPDEKINEDALLSHKEYENFCSISRQLVQIENQQSSLLNLLQGFIGSSRNGMSSLEKRVNGLERLLDEMQHDLAITTGKLSNTDDLTRSACCMLPRAEFLSPKLWRSSEGQNSNSRISFSTGSQNNTVYNLPDTYATTKMLKQKNLTGQKQNKNISSLNYMDVTQNEGNLALHSSSDRRKERIARDGETAGFCHVGRLNGTSFANCIQQRT